MSIVIDSAPMEPEAANATPSSLRRRSKVSSLRLADRFNRILTTDFCPNLNKFVYWLKEPAGWFVLAISVNVLIGLYFNPIGWTLAAALVAILAIGMAWPWIAVRATTCGLRPEVSAVHEGHPCRLLFRVRNRLPIPVWGLAIEGYLDADLHGDRSTEDATAPVVGLAHVPPLSTAEYGISVTPTSRGHCPVEMPKVVCSFPFGIWTARRDLENAEPLTVWPEVFPVSGGCENAGQSRADSGEGQHSDRTGEFVGVRAYRRGDSTKQIHWVASARTDSLVVTERGGPELPLIEVWVDTRAGRTREALSRRVRVAASVLLNLQRSSTAMRITLGDRALPVASGPKGRLQILDALAAVPLDGVAPPMERKKGRFKRSGPSAPGSQSAQATAKAKLSRSSAAMRLEFSSTEGDDVIASVVERGALRASDQRGRVVKWSPAEQLDKLLSRFWWEVRNVASKAA